MFVKLSDTHLHQATHLDMFLFYNFAFATYQDCILINNKTPDVGLNFSG